MKKLSPDSFLAVLNEVTLLGNGQTTRWTVKSSLPTVPHLAQLTALALVLGKIFEKEVAESLGQTPLRQIKARVAEINRQSKRIWTAAIQLPTAAERDQKLEDIRPLQDPLEELRRNWRAEFPQFRGQMQLADFTDDVGASLAELSERIGQWGTQALRQRDGGDQVGIGPGPITPAIGLARLAGGLSKQLSATEEEVTLAAILAGLGSAEVEDGAENGGEVSAAGDRKRITDEMRANFAELEQHLRN